MSTTTRVMNGLVNLEGSTVGTLKVGDMTARRPQPRYRTVCMRCGAQSTESHIRLTSGAARCMAADCGKAKPRGRDLLDEHRQRIADNEAQRAEEERQASELRMQVETEGYEVKRTPFRVQEAGPMSDRDRRSIRDFLDSEESVHRAAETSRQEAERQAAQDREAADAVKRDREEKQRMYWAEWVSTDRDPQFQVSDEIRNASMPKAQADAFTAKAAQEFAKSPEYAQYRTLENADIILSYLHRNGCYIADVETIRAAFVRLKSLVMLKAKAAPAPQPQRQEPQPEGMTVEPPPATPIEAQGPRVYRGRDYVTGLERDFTEREVNRMSSLEFQRAFKVLPSVSELFTTINNAR